MHKPGVEKRVAGSLAAGAILLAVCGYPVMFDGFSPWDDEGYFLVGVREFARGHSLYGRVSSIYGPLYYEVMRLVAFMNPQMVSHDWGRAVTLLMWVTSSLILAVAVLKMTRNAVLAAGTLLVAFSDLVALHNEPTHPTGLVALILSLLTLAISSNWRAGWKGRPAWTVGALIASLALTKVNAGAFGALALVVLLTTSPPRWWPPWTVWLLRTCLVVVPVLLMRSDLANAKTAKYALLVSLAVIGLLLCASRTRRAQEVRWLHFASGMATLYVCVLGLLIAMGGSLSGWAAQTIFEPLQLASFFSSPLFMQDFELGLTGLGCAVLYPLALRGSITQHQLRNVLVLCGGVTWLLIFFRHDPLPMLLIMPLILILPDSNPSLILLIALAVFQALYAYPVAGTQVAIAGYLLIPIAALMIGCSGAEKSIAEGKSRLVLRYVLAAFLGLMVVWTAHRALSAAASYRRDVSLDLPGAHAMRVPPAERTSYVALTSYLTTHCGTSASMPWVNSLHLWSREDPPTDLTADDWVFGVNDSRQAQMLAEILARRDVCLVRNDELIRFWGRGHVIPSRPLARYFAKSRLVTRIGDFQILESRP